MSVEQLIVALPPGGNFRVGAYPNACSAPSPGAANHTLQQVDFNISPAAVLKAQAQEWVQRGATVLGGCCGVGPEHILAMTSLKIHNDKTNCLQNFWCLKRFMAAVVAFLIVSSCLD